MALLEVAQNSLVAVALAAVAALVELLRVLVAYALCARKSAQVRALAKEKIVLQFELSKIKSAQLELVKKSKLERALIETEKKIDNLKDDVLPALRVHLRRVFLYIRGVVYCLVSLACFNLDIVIVDSNMFFPFAIWPNKLMNLPAWALVAISALTTRHILRTLIPLISSEVIV